MVRNRIPERGPDGRAIAAGVVTVQDRADDFWGQVNKGGDCWLWEGKQNPRHRYGQFYVGWNGARYLEMRAHRVAWEIVNGPIPKGMHILHHCDSPLCVNPAHLWMGTHSDNMKDAAAKGRLKWQKATALYDKIAAGYFTREDVRFLREQGCVDTLANPSCHVIATDDAPEHRRLADIIARIEALLPPEDA